MINEVKLGSPTESAASLCSFGFEDPVHGIYVPCPHLDGPREEVWSTAESRSGAFFSVVHVEHCYRGRNLSEVTAKAYTELLARIERTQHRFIVRMWNFFPEITRGEGERESYRQFCSGRVHARGWRELGLPPAATVIGARDQGEQVLRVVALCSRESGIPVENPRQVSSWRYSETYGRIPPSFSRGMLVPLERGGCLLASGTASIVAERTVHKGELHGQVGEILRNLDSLVARASEVSGIQFDRGGAVGMRAYLRNRGDLPALQAAIAALWPNAPPIVVALGDVCRQDLLVEFEGAFFARTGETLRM